MFIIPDNIVSKFLAIASKNVSPVDKKHIETLAFLIGHEENGTFIGKDLYFPQQHGTSCQVHDDGKFCSLYNSKAFQKYIQTSL